jgi:hypothetical protein
MPAALASPPSFPPRINYGVNSSGNPEADQPGRHNQMMKMQQDPFKGFKNLQ